MTIKEMLEKLLENNVTGKTELLMKIDCEYATVTNVVDLIYNSENDTITLTRYETDKQSEPDESL